MTQISMSVAVIFFRVWIGLHTVRANQHRHAANGTNYTAGIFFMCIVAIDAATNDIG